MPDRRPPTPDTVHRALTGEEAQVDFGAGAPIVGPDGRRRRTHVFRMVLSRLGVAKRTPSHRDAPIPAGSVLVDATVFTPPARRLRVAVQPFHHGGHPLRVGLR